MGGWYHFARAMFMNTLSAGSPSLSYMAAKNAGSISTIIAITAAVFPTAPFDRKYAGTPTAAAAPKHTSCLFVRLNSTFVLTLDRSFGTLTYAMI